MIDISDKNKINEFFTSNGFVKKRNHYFRVVNNRILQCAVYEYNPKLREPYACFGMASLYSDLHKDYFTSRGFGFEIYGMRSVKMCHENFEELAISYMNNVNDEKSLITAFDELDKKEYGQLVLNNELRIAPYLICRQYDDAQKVISAILLQHNDALLSSKNNFVWSDELFNDKKAEQLVQDAKLYRLSALLDSCDIVAIDDILKANYSKNLKAARRSNLIEQ